MCTITQERFIYKNFNNQLQSSSIDSNNKTMLVISQLAMIREDIDHSVTSRALEWVFDQVLMRIWEVFNHVFNLVCESPLTPKLAWYLLTIALFLVVQYTVQVIHDCRTLPRGPFGLPIWGVLNFIKKPFHHYLWDKQKKYGKLYTCKMGQSLQVVISCPKLIREAFSNWDMAARPNTEIFKQVIGGLGIVNSEGLLWHNNRNFILNQKLGLKNAWSHMGRVEELVRGQVNDLVRTIEHTFDGQSVEPNMLFNCAISNVICSMVMSRTFEYNDPQFIRFMENFDEGFKLFVEAGAVSFIPMLRHFPGCSRSIEKIKANRAEMMTFIRTVIEEHQEQMRTEGYDAAQPRDLMEAYLIALEREDARIFPEGRAMEQIEQTVLDLFSAGVETTKNSLLWAIVYMLREPEVMLKVQAELAAVVGEERLPTMDDMVELPYTKATLYEVMRTSSVVPMGTTHATTRAVKFQGYTIPKGAHVVSLLCAVHNDPDYWPEPEVFDPLRFLDPEDPTKVVKPEAFLPFGVGKRACLGERLAEKQFFLFFASILHAMTLECPRTPTLDGIPGASVAPVPFDVIFRVRPHIKAMLSGLPAERPPCDHA